MPRRSNLDTAQRTEAVLRLLRREEPAVKIARRFGISEQTLYRLRDRFLEAGQLALAGTAGKTDPRQSLIHTLGRDLAERDRLIGELTVTLRRLQGSNV